MIRNYQCFLHGLYVFIIQHLIDLRLSWEHNSEWPIPTKKLFTIMIYSLLDGKEEGNLYIKFDITYLIDE